MKKEELVAALYEFWENSKEVKVLTKAIDEINGSEFAPSSLIIDYYLDGECLHHIGAEGKFHGATFENTEVEMIMEEDDDEDTKEHTDYDGKRDVFFRHKQMLLTRLCENLSAIVELKTGTKLLCV